MNDQAAARGCCASASVLVQEQAAGSRAAARRPSKPVRLHLGGSSALLSPLLRSLLLCGCSEQEEREARKEAGLPPPPEEMAPVRGSHDSGDPFTTNLFIGNLAPDVDEQVRAWRGDARGAQLLCCCSSAFVCTVPC